MSYDKTKADPALGQKVHEHFSLSWSRNSGY